MIEILTAVMAAGDSRDFHINGERFEILECQYPIDVLLMDKAGAQQSTMKNAEASFFAQPREGFQTIKITSQQAQVVRMFVGSGDAGTRRISSTVQVIDGGRARTISDAAYFSSASFGPAGGALNAMALVNPAASGRRIIINGLLFATDVASTVQLRRGVGVAAGSAVVPESKYVGGAGSAQGRTYTYAGGTPGGTVMAGFGTGAGVSVVVPISEPFVIAPGAYLSVVNAVASVALSAYMQFYEEAV